MATSFTDGTTAIVPFAVQPYAAFRASQNIVHQVVGSSVPDVTLVAAGPRTGTFTAGFYTEADASGFANMVAQAVVIQSTSDELVSMNLKFVLDGTLGVTIDPTTLAFWTVSVDFREVPSA